MSDTSGKEGTTPEQQRRKMRRLMRESRLWEIVTFVIVIIVSPASFVLGLPLGITPAVWLAFWLHWTAVFIVFAIIIALLGFDKSLSCSLRAERIERQLESGTSG
jgi:hypothetical protein